MQLLSIFVIVSTLVGIGYSDSSDEDDKLTSLLAVKSSSENSSDSSAIEASRFRNLPASASSGLSSTSEKKAESAARFFNSGSRGKGISELFCRYFGICNSRNPDNDNESSWSKPFWPAKPVSPNRPTPQTGNQDDSSQNSKPAGSIAPASQQCGVQDPSHQPLIASSRQRIINGEDAEPHSWPWTVNLRAGSAMCGGTLIRKDVVLTAAHCVERANRASDIRVTVGAHMIGGWSRRAGTTVQAVDMIKHEQYDSDTVANDIALIRLSRGFEDSDTVRQACVPPSGQNPSVGSECVIVGWGVTSNSWFARKSASTLQQASVPIVSNQECVQKHGGQVRSTMICAGGRSQDSCQGDSGGPLLCKQGNQWNVHGITSWGAANCGTQGLPAVYTRVSSYSDWLNEKLQQSSWASRSRGIASGRQKWSKLPVRFN